MVAGDENKLIALDAPQVDNERWRGVPFLFTAGKGMDERVCELRIRYKTQSTNLIMGVLQQNELVLRVQVSSLDHPRASHSGLIQSRLISPHLGACSMCSRTRPST